MITKHWCRSRVAPLIEWKLKPPASQLRHLHCARGEVKTLTDWSHVKGGVMQEPGRRLCAVLLDRTGDKIQYNMYIDNLARVPDTYLSTRDDSVFDLDLCWGSFPAPNIILHASLLKTTSTRIIQGDWLPSFGQIIHAACIIIFFFTEPPSWVRQRPVSHSFATAGAKKERRDIITRNPSDS